MAPKAANAPKPQEEAANAPQAANAPKPQEEAKGGGKGGYDAGGPAASVPEARSPSKPEELSKAEKDTVVRRRARTHSCFIEERDVELLITEYESIDHTYLASMGKHHKVDRWRILVAGLPDAIELELNVDKTVALNPMVSIVANKERVFPAFGDKPSAKMKEDFNHKWTFRGIPDGFREKHRFEVKPQWGGAGDWFPATLTSRRAQDGTYEASALMLEHVGGVRQEVVLVGIKTADIRYRDTKQPPKLATRTLLLNVPKDQPHRATLKVLNSGSETEGTDVTNLFGRWSPGEKGAHCEAKPVALAGPGGLQGPKVSPTITMQVTKNVIGKEVISASVGHTTLQHFMSGEVRAIACHDNERIALDRSKLKKEWTIQVGPLVEHKISIERKNRLSKIMTLTIDDSRLVESLSQDMTDNSADSWTCAFRLVGDKFLEFKMDDAHSLKELGVKKMEEKLLPAGEHSAYPDTVSTPIRFTHDCLIAMKDINNIGTARLYIDGQDFTSLRPRQPAPVGEMNITDMPGEVLLGTYGVIIPHMVVVNSVMRGLAWPVQGLEAARAGLPSLEETSSAAAQFARDVAPVMEEAKIQSIRAVQALHEGLGNFMAGLQGMSSPFAIPQCTAPQGHDEHEVVGR